LLPRELSLTRGKEGGERTERGGTLPRGARGESSVVTDAVSAVWPCGREGGVAEWAGNRKLGLVIEWARLGVGIFFFKEKRVWIF
jgi:hypothetical protein